MAATFHLEIVTIEGKQFDGPVNAIVAPGIEGALGILPRHAPLLTSLDYGELQVKIKDEPDQFFAIGGGFMEVQPDHVIVLADSAERAEEIDIERAKAARERAKTRLERAEAEADFEQALASLHKSRTRLHVAQKHFEKRRQRARDQSLPSE